jgi:hypothetical protein
VTDPQAFYAATSPPAVADPATLLYRVDFTTARRDHRHRAEGRSRDGASSNAPYVSGQAIEIDGMSFTVNGSPRPATPSSCASRRLAGVFDTPGHGHRRS